MANSLRLTVNGSSICRAWRRKRAEDHLTSAQVRRLRCSEPRDGLDGFPRILARTIELNEPRVPIGELGFTEGYALLDVGEDTQKSTSMHAAQYTTTPVSRALKRVSKLSKAKIAAVSAGGSERRVERDGNGPWRRLFRLRQTGL